MLIQWFNAREAVAAGATLADHFLPRQAAAGNARVPKDWRSDVPRFRQRIAHETCSLKLNLFKRARLLNAFKWRLLEHGFDPIAANELTQVVVMQLCAGDTGSSIRAFSAALSPHKTQSSRRLPMLLTEADGLFGEGKFAEAAKRLREALTLEGRSAEAHAKLGSVLCHLGRYGEAESALRRAVEIKASCASAHLNLGTLLRDKGQFAASEAALRRAVKEDARDAQALASLGLTLGMRGRLKEARECFEKALRLRPQDAGALCSFGWLAGIDGRFEEAERHYRAALQADSRLPGAWALLVGLRRMTDADKDWFRGVEQTLAHGVSPLDESKLRYAMGKYFDDLGRYPRAFEQYRRANDLRKAVSVPYDRAERTTFVDEMIGTYTRQRLAEPTKGVSGSAKSVIVTGMMRSGTSLVEQIIASHPQASGAGELDFWSTRAFKQQQSLRRQMPDEPLARKLGDSYLKVLEQHSATALRVVDKSTFNTDHLGLIHSVLPRARLIYVHRDPIDTCLSCYFQDFANAASFTMDLSDLAHYYREHHRLIAHWRSAVPQSALLLVPYAGLVADPRTWSRRIIEFIGLEWDSQCLEFHKTDRAVLTASNWQVRQPVYSRSVGRWRNYEKFIRPLLEIRELTLA